MPTPPTQRAVRATRRTPLRRLRHLLALTAVALPLVVLAPAPAGVAGRALASETPAVPTPHTVKVSDGLAIQLALTDAPTVHDALDAFGVALGPLDRVTPDLTSTIDGPTAITIARVELIEEEVRTELARDVVRIDDDALLRGYARVVQQGRTGMRVDTQLALIVDGEEESRLTVASEIVREPRDRILRVGTRMLPGDTIWDALARCEAAGRWDAVRMSGGQVLFSGGLQFTPRTWNAFRPEGFPDHAADATREQQIAVAERVLARQGWGAWPGCSLRLGLR